MGRGDPDTAKKECSEDKHAQLKSDLKNKRKIDRNTIQACITVRLGERVRVKLSMQVIKVVCCLLSSFSCTICGMIPR